MIESIWIKWALAFVASLFLLLELEDMVPLGTKLSATMTKQGRTYQVTINKGESMNI